MDTEFLAALDDVNGQVHEPLMDTQAFSPPSLSSSQLKQLELLQHLSLYSELLILVCAEKGMGKTFIAKALFASREVPDQSLMLEADFSLSYLDILHNLVQFLDLADRADDIEEIEQQVLAQCLQIAEEDQGSILLIIDQADQLNDDLLSDINHLALLAPSALHIMLLAPPGFEAKLLALVEPQAPFHMMDIERLSDDEAEILLLEQFPEKEWPAEQADYIIQQSVGNPGKILYLAQQFLSGSKPHKGEGGATKFPVTHVAAMLLVAFALIFAYFYQNRSVEIEDPLAAKDTSVEVATFNEAASLNVDQGVELNSEKIEPVEEVDFNFPNADTVDSTLVQDTVSSQPIKNELVNESVSSEPALSNDNKLKEPVIIYSKDEQVLMLASSSAFVIQLFGSYSEDNARVFMNTHATKTLKLLTYEAEYKGKPWHVVIAGPFESREAALKQSKGLTAKLRSQKPWIRPLSDIQLVLKSRK